MRVVLKEVRISYPKLFVPEAFEASANKRFGARFHITPGSEQDKLVREAINAVALEAWDKKAGAMLKSFEGNNQKICFYDGNLSNDANAEGMFILSSNRNEKDGKPKVKDRRGNDLAEGDAKIYGGCYVNAILDFYAQKDKYPGIRCTLLGVQFVKDGPSFGGAARIGDDAFEDLGSDGEDGDIDDAGLL